MKKGLHPQMQWVSYVTPSGRLINFMMTKIHSVGKVYHLRAKRQMAASVGQIAKFNRRLNGSLGITSNTVQSRPVIDQLVLHLVSQNSVLKLVHVFDDAIHRFGPQSLGFCVLYSVLWGFVWLEVGKCSFASLVDFLKVIETMGHLFPSVSANALSKTKS
ncbi:hypothetical protein Gotri_011827, partial [Gossypium trilobum]|nr:hypothetical protein [Gossypium trilobum]